jgi:hypothetical protein
MPFIGQEPITGAYHVLDAITASATATYNLQLNSGAFSPATANQLLVSLNGVIQKPGSSFTISGSQITFSSALTSSDSIDFIIALGDVLNVGTPTDGTVSTASLAPSAVTDAKIADMAASKLTGTVAGARMPTGSVIQFKETVVTSAISLPTATGQYHTIPSVNVSITPSASTSKIFIMVKLELGHAPIGNTSIQLMRDSTAVGIGDASSNAQRASFSMAQRSHSAYEVQQINHHFLDSPSTTSAITYSLRYFNNYSTAQMYLGRTHNSITGADDEMYPSIITAMEIAG